MGLSSKVDQGVDWGEALVKALPSRRQAQAQAEALKCPRCASTNTKFCYYNNYNKSQPRHFCKSCKRHWTKGGTLRNVPVGGGRKNKRSKSNPKPAAHKNMLYHALISSPLRLHSSTSKPIDDITSSSLAAAANAPQIIPNADFQFSSLSTFDVDASLNPTSYQPLNAFHHFAGNLDEESTITTVNIPGTSSGGAMDFPNYWSWNDIDVLTSADLSLSWDDEDKAAIKP